MLHILRLRMAHDCHWLLSVRQRLDINSVIAVLFLYSGKYPVVVPTHEVDLAPITSPYRLE